MLIVLAVVEGEAGSGGGAWRLEAVAGVVMGSGRVMHTLWLLDAAHGGVRALVPQVAVCMTLLVEQTGVPCCLCACLDGV